MNSGMSMKRKLFLIFSAIVLFIIIFANFSSDLNFRWGSCSTLNVMKKYPGCRGIAFAETCSYSGIQIPRLNFEYTLNKDCQPI